MLTDEEAAALAAIDEAALGRTLMELIAVPSVTGSAAESELQHQLAGRLEWLGLEVDLWSMDLPALRAHPGFPGMEVPREEAWGLVGTTQDGGDGPTLILQGHVDVVPPGDPEAWGDGDPFVPRVTGDVVHGRGACDMKAGLAAHLAALTAIRTAGIRLRGRVAAHFVVGEEDGGIGAFGTLERGHRGDACVIAEPTGSTLITANAGALTFRLAVPGRAAHGSAREQGVSAVDAYLPLHRALAALETERNRNPSPLLAEYPIPYALSVGTVRAGDWASSVPDLLVAEGRLGVRLDEDPAEARADLERCVAEACAADPWLRDHPATVTWPGGRFASGRLPEGHPLPDVVGAAHTDATGAPPPRRRGATYGSDLRHYTGAGIPTLQFGPGDIEVAHSPREQVSLRETVAVARTMVLTVLRTVGTK
ncbi:ArgE/DapE family deacylase [Streptomyces sp. NPDC050388]|uniref:ArgE/DapE family deacylase n=1 Tax=Streptomyces sp. NPDC050388 TaxID=3155781 RepID=UPI003430C513